MNLCQASECENANTKLERPMIKRGCISQIPPCVFHKFLPAVLLGKKNVIDNEMDLLNRWFDDSDRISKGKDGHNS